MADLEDTLRRHIAEKLPISASDALYAPERFQHYYDDPSLARIVMHTTEDKASSVLPWALYSSFTHVINGSIDPQNEKMFKAQPELIGFEFITFSYPMMLVSQVVARAFAQWNHQIDKFYVGGCTRITTIAEGTQCSRSSSRLDSQDPLYLSPDDRQVDAVKSMAPRIREFITQMSISGGPYDGWCVSCANTLKRTMENIVLDIYPGLVGCIAAVTDDSAAKDSCTIQ